MNTKVQLIRSACVKITINNVCFLIDPMLAPKGTYEGFANTYNSHLRNPLVDLPFSFEEIINDVNAVIITHNHLDHIDEYTCKKLDKNIKVFVQDNQDYNYFKDLGFKNLEILSDTLEFQGVKLTKTKAKHGSEEIYKNEELARLLGDTMGVIFSAKDCKSVYLIGDSVLTKDVENTLKQNYDIVIVNAGNAMVLGFDDSIIMNENDIKNIAKISTSKIIAVHLEAINHCILTRKALKEFVNKNNLNDRVLIPDDGESYIF
ncbi:MULTISPECIES: MBL fold metallo-hydrolase [unclassified Campylobacter]|uniref:MBL fold metallo-hydrolase n=1 Tax=unclassified Campylobacter TaxID=2593542 RepID=UPI001BDB187A|nr:MULTISPECIES: MBL fold metallo-hydrolase [unclassified Campylobacter]MBT0883298.1 MBL fold metallo-hydrolase [Campylobacter sp. 2018MI13]ULO03098.1 beta-lactamase family protein [Campylobacter sp. RM12651]